MSWLSDLLGKTIKVDGTAYPDRKNLNLISGQDVDISVVDNDEEASTDVTIVLSMQPNTKVGVEPYFFPGVFLGLFDVSTQETIPNSVAFRNDGTRMFVVGSNSDSVHQYDLSTAWDVSTAVFVSSFDVSAQDTFPQGVAFRDNGTRMFVVGLGSDAVYQYDLSTAWDVSTAVFVSSFDVSAQDGQPTGIAFRDDGTRMYVTGTVGDDVNQYDLSTAWDVSTAVFDSSFFVSAQETTPSGVAFRDDGTQMFVVGIVGDSVYRYGLSTAWDVTTASFTDSFDISGQGTTHTDVFFGESGLFMYTSETSTGEILQYATNKLFLEPA